MKVWIVQSGTYYESDNAIEAVCATEEGALEAAACMQKPRQWCLPQEWRPIALSSGNEKHRWERLGSNWISITEHEVRPYGTFESVTRQRDALWNALDLYGQHKAACQAGLDHARARGEQELCTCGLSRALNAWRKDA